MHELRDIPPEPQVPDDQRGAGPLPLRYEDVVQDGRLKLEPVTHAIGAAVWRRTLAEHPVAQRMRDEGILPILSRLQVEAGGGPISARFPLQARGTFELVHTMDESEKVRLRVDMWAELCGVRGSTHGPDPDGSEEPMAVGRVIAEHVLTRPFAPPEERAVHDIPGGLPEGVTMRDVSWRAPRTAMELPRGAKAIDDAFALDPVPIVFGLGHTDSNQHVNSLAYPRVAEGHALRALAEGGVPDAYAIAIASVDVCWAKPLFAGDTVVVATRAYELGARYLVTSAFAPAGAPRPHATVRFELERES